jgi:hypothetical protein
LQKIKDDEDELKVIHVGLMINEACIPVFAKEVTQKNGSQ